MEYDAIVILCAGRPEDGPLSQAAAAKADKAISLFTGKEKIIASTRYTVHKPPLMLRGFPVSESLSYANYLQKEGIPKESILLEESSYDTIGNAFFTRAIHTDIAGFRKLAIVTSDYHMERSRQVCDWIFGLSPYRDYELEYHSSKDIGLGEDLLQIRKAKEDSRIAALQVLKERITTMKALHDWLFSEHSAYAFGKTPPIHEGRILDTY